MRPTWVSDASPLLIEPNATMPMTPKTTTIVPCSSSVRSYVGYTKKQGRTYISLLVTGVPTKNLANKKLKMRELEPRGATYSDKGRLSQLISPPQEETYLHACIQVRACFLSIGII